MDEVKGGKKWDELKETHHLRLDADDGCLVEIQQVWFPARNDVFFPTWQTVKCASP